MLWLKNQVWKKSNAAQGGLSGIWIDCTITRLPRWQKEELAIAALVVAAKHYVSAVATQYAKSAFGKMTAKMTKMPLL